MKTCKEIVRWLDDCSCMLCNEAVYVHFHLVLVSILFTSLMKWLRRIIQNSLCKTLTIFIINFSRYYRCFFKSIINKILFSFSSILSLNVTVFVWWCLCCHFNDLIMFGCLFNNLNSSGEVFISQRFNCNVIIIIKQWLNKNDDHFIELWNINVFLYLSLNELIMFGCFVSINDNLSNSLVFKLQRNLFDS